MDYFGHTCQSFEMVFRLAGRGRLPSTSDISSTTAIDIFKELEAALNKVTLLNYYLFPRRDLLCVLCIHCFQYTFVQVLRLIPPYFLLELFVCFLVLLDSLNMPGYVVIFFERMAVTADFSMLRVLLRVLVCFFQLFICILDQCGSYILVSHILFLCRISL